MVVDGHGEPLPDAEIQAFDFPPDGNTDRQLPRQETSVNDDGGFYFSVGVAPGVEIVELVTTCEGYDEDRRLAHLQDKREHRIVLSHSDGDLASPENED